MQKYTEGIIENTELVYVDPGDDEEIIELIEVLNVGVLPIFIIKAV